MENAGALAHLFPKSSSLLKHSAEKSLNEDGNTSGSQVFLASGGNGEGQPEEELIEPNSFTCHHFKIDHVSHELGFHFKANHYCDCIFPPQFCVGSQFVPFR
jgi:hypothetical protein